MTVEERLDRITERHEALVQTLELIAIQTEQNTRSIEQLGIRNEETRQVIDKLANATATLAVRGDKASKEIEVMRQSVIDLVNVARSHDKRIAGLEAA